MYASDYLRSKFQSDRQLAIYAERSMSGVINESKGVLSDIYSGLERVSWYSSCFIPKYNDICQELKHEEMRTVYSIQSIFRYTDVFQYMLFLYFDKVSGDIEKGGKHGTTQGLIETTAGLGARVATGKGTRYALAYSLSVALAHSGFLSKIVVERLSLRLPKVALVLQFFGIEQKAALAARHLKVLEPDYYWILYNAQLEMLYYFIEPLLSVIIKKVKAGNFSSIDDFADDIRSKYGV